MGTTERSWVRLQDDRNEQPRHGNHSREKDIGAFHGSVWAQVQVVPGLPKPTSWYKVGLIRKLLSEARR